ncbi:hypothetical protein Bpfe_016371 [Biomphalaria pfeifferi]|uniref:Uncharacterized protein n=1 Tax=Biomphalaria pfeifferi TaxID=112525 RepID=A0AAD8BGF9_BIOPF|nr:hypothetical protein Bpfe_016371 [Biomphalaria pfeifferi]
MSIRKPVTLSMTELFPPRSHTSHRTLLEAYPTGHSSITYNHPPILSPPSLPRSLIPAPLLRHFRPAL